MDARTAVAGRAGRSGGHENADIVPTSQNYPCRTDRRIIPIREVGWRFSRTSLYGDSDLSAPGAANPNSVGRAVMTNNARHQPNDYSPPLHGSSSGRRTSPARTQPSARH
ncbi:hypothetical protein Bbelb_437680 [Branchiostoma belcheri]|nr:hypothetical protein Bbelb_437680 [Branchiostoma belcheri]